MGGNTPLSRVSLLLVLIAFIALTFLAFLLGYSSMSSVEYGYNFADDDDEYDDSFLPIIDRNETAINTFYSINNEKNPTRPVRVVFYSAHNSFGYGNRIYSLLSAFLIAYLTDSVLLIDWPDIRAFIRSPFRLTFKKFTDYSYFDVANKSPPILSLVTGTVNSWKFNKSLVTNQSLPIKAYSRIFINQYDAYFFDLCSNPEFFDQLVKFTLVSNKTIERALVSLKTPNESLGNKLEHLYRVGFEYAGTVLRRHWRLRRFLLEKIHHFEEAFLKGYYVIGLQMRSEYLDRQDIDTFIICALRRETEFFLNKRTNMSSSPLPVRWYISTDSAKVLRKLMNGKYASKVISGVGIIGHVGAKRRSLAGYERTLFDIEILSRCNETIITGGSTFGFISALMSQKLPFYLNGKQGDKECRQFSFTQPTLRPDTRSSIF
jgi:hypothetical protein